MSTKTLVYLALIVCISLSLEDDSSTLENMALQLIKLLRNGYTFKTTQKVLLMIIVLQLPRILPKAGVKSFLKKIPAVGFVAGIGFGIWRLLNGQVAKAAGEVVSGAASTMPGPGTAASATIDMTLLAADISEFLIEQGMIEVK